MRTINPYLIFNGNAEEAFTFYQIVFGGELQIIYFKDMPGTKDMAEEDRKKVAHVALPIEGSNQMLMASDATTGREAEKVSNGNYYISFEAKSVDEAEKIYQFLSKDGHEIMPLNKTEWAEKFGMLSDKFGIQWMVSFSGEIAE